MERTVDLARNKIYHLKNSLITYDVDNAETIEKIVTTIQSTHYKPTWYVSEQGTVHYAINSSLYLKTLKEKYITLHENLTYRLEIYANAIRILS